MLIQFNFKNYKSFRDEVTLDFTATKMTEFSDRVVSIGGERVLPLAAIYGANASGKSNVYSAFEFMSKYVVNSFKYGDDEKKYEDVRPQPFLFDSVSEQSESSFEVYFTVPRDKSERIYNYGFCLGPDGVTEEWLNSKAKTAREYLPIFYRGPDGLDLHKIPKSSQNNIKVALEKQVLIASLGAKLRIEKCKLVRDWFLVNEFADFGDVISNLFLSRRLPNGFIDDPAVRADIVKFFASFDNQIRELDSDEMAKIPLNSESAGTLKMFALYPDLYDVMKCGSVFFVDELNARLHPLLVRNFILTFANPEINVNHSQLIFTTHDTWQLSNQLLRRDEIWFTEKNSDGISNLYSLADFVDEDGEHIRKDESYEKNYLLGKYGAIPTLETISLLKKEY